MSLQEQINDDFKAAMKGQNQATLSTLRMLKSALKNKQIDLMHELTEEEAMTVVKSQIKQLRDAADEYAAGAREEMAESARQEVRVLEKYLPAQMDDATLHTKVKEALAAAGMTSKNDAGKAMGVAMKAVAGQADGSRVRAVVETILVGLVLTIVATFVDAPTVHAAAATASSGDAAYLVPALRVGRTFLLLLGLVAVNMVVIGGFTFMTASGRDHGHEHGMEKMGVGILCTVLIAMLFSIATVALDRLQT